MLYWDYSCQIQRYYKFDADFQAVREEQNWYSKLSIPGRLDSNFGVNFLAYIMLLFTISLVQYIL